MDYKKFGDSLSKLYPRFYRYHNGEDYYEEDSAPETDDGCYPAYTEKYRQKDKKFLDDFVAEFPNKFVMYVINNETNCSLKIEWNGDFEEFFDNIYTLRGHRCVFTTLAYSKMYNNIPYFDVRFD